MSIVYYEGDRIYFRPIEVEDTKTFQRWINDPRIWSTLGHRLPINEHREREWMESNGKDDRHVVFGVVVRDGEKLIGSTGLHRINRTNRCAEFGIVIGDIESHDRGFGTEAAKLTLRYAFEELNLHRVYLGVFSHNPRAIRAYEKAGFVCEGCDRKAHWKHGAYHDMLRYAALRDEWLSEQDKARNSNKETQEV